MLSLSSMTRPSTLQTGRSQDFMSIILDYTCRFRAKDKDENREVIDGATTLICDTTSYILYLLITFSKNTKSIPQLLSHSVVGTVCVCQRQRQRAGQTNKDLHYSLPTHTIHLHLVASFTGMRALLQPDHRALLDSFWEVLLFTVTAVCNAAVTAGTHNKINQLISSSSLLILLSYWTETLVMRFLWLLNRGDSSTWWNGAI